VAFLGASALGYFAAAVSDGGPDTWRLLSATAFLVCAALSLYSYFKKR
jgi:hypothetical protein